MPPKKIPFSVQVASCFHKMLLRTNSYTGTFQEYIKKYIKKYSYSEIFRVVTF